MTQALRPDLAAIAEMIKGGARVLDIGCGDGKLLEHLMTTKRVDGRGLELSQPNVNACVARGLDARKEEDVNAFLKEADAHAPLEICIFNPGANVNFPILDTTERVFRKVWEMACYGGFLAGREAARLMLARGKGTILFTGATASLRGGIGYAAFASAKFGLRAVAQSMARELGPKNIHVAHLIIDAGVDTAFVRERIKARGGDPDTLPPDTLMEPKSVADAYWYLHAQTRDAWTFELDVRPYKETW